MGSNAVASAFPAANGLSYFGRYNGNIDVADLSAKAAAHALRKRWHEERCKTQ